jgi:hypothetical protein
VDQDLPSFINEQIEAARREADEWRARGMARGARGWTAPTEQLPPALRRIAQRFETGLRRSVETGRMCPHKDPARAQPTHLFASHPDVRFCEQCAAPILATQPTVCDLCDATCDPTLVHYSMGYLMFHTALCDDCYPEGADAPRVPQGGGGL